MRAWLSCLRLLWGARVSQDYDQDQPIHLARLRAKSLLEAVDAGGLPTDPILVNRIGRALGLTVLPSDPMNMTIQKIRQVLDSSAVRP
jgi:hypothetical protein